MSDDLRLPIRFVIHRNDADFKKDMVDYFTNHKKLKAVRFGYTTEYAEVLEYGCGPLNDFQPTVHGGSYTYKTIYDAIYDWAGKKDGKGRGPYKLPIEDEAERRAFTKKVVDRFFMYGMKPHTYYRPAIDFLRDNMQKLFDEGYSLFEICDEALRISNKCIMDFNLPFSGKLQRSALIEEVDKRDIAKVKDKKDWTDEEWDDVFERAGWV